MTHSTLRHHLARLATAALAFAGTAVVVLWSWNTLMELFGGPHAEFRHAVAALAPIVVLAFALTRHRGPHAVTPTD